MQPRQATSPSSLDARFQAAFEEEEYRGLRLATGVRLAALAVIAIWIPAENPFPQVLYYHGLLVVFALLGIAPLALHRAGLYAPWLRYLFPLLDVGVFTLAVLMPNPLEHDDIPAPMRLRFGNEIYLFLFLMVAAFTSSPRVVLWTGLTAASTWMVGTLWILHLPGSSSFLPQGLLARMTAEQRLAARFGPHQVNLGMLGRQVVVILVVAGAVAAVVRRSRRLVVRQAQAERERANLSRYFSPNMVEELAQSDEPLRATRTQNVAVLFVDIAGFTSWSATRPPDVVIRFLREFHGRMARAVFAHDGTVDKYLGDGIMATFGTPRSSERDATNALHCIRAMLTTLAAWNVERVRDGEAPLHIGLGAHYGSVVLGDIGDEQHLEFAVIGDTVNVASRLQELTRTLNTAALVSQDLIDAAHLEPAFAPADLDGLEALAAQEVRGRSGLLHLWTLRQAPAPPPTAHSAAAPRS